MVAAVASTSVLLAVPGSAGAAVNRVPREDVRVVTTVAPITSIVASVGSDLVTIHGLVPEGADSHTFEPAPSAARELSQADVVFVNGLGLEDPTERLARRNLKPGAEIVELGARAITKRQYLYDFSFPKSGGKPNPHLWTNPPYAKSYARVVADVLARRDPRHAAEFEANFRRFATQADALDAAMKQASASMTDRQRRLLTYHDAYAYFGRHYRWKIVGAIQVSSFEDPTPRQVGRLIMQVRRLGVPAIFGSEVFPSPVLEQIGDEAHVRYVDKLRDDDLPGEPGDSGHSWLGLMKLDFVTMVKALRGDASPLLAVPTSLVRDRAVYPQ